MPSNKSAFYRYLLIDKRIANKYQPYPNLEELKSYIEEKTGQNISTRQLEYDLAEMKNSEVLAFYAPIEFDKTNKGYKYSDSKYSIGQFVKLNQEDLDSLEMAFEILDTYKGIDVFKNFKVAIDKMNNEFSVTKNHSAIEVENILQPQINSSSEGLQWLNILVGLIKEKSSIKVLYGKFSGDKKYYVLSPLILKEFDSRWYLVARDAKDKIIKVFGLERILEIEKDESSYELGDFNKHLKESKGKPFSEQKILHFLANIFLAVFHINSRNIFHRDLKPANFLLKREKNGINYLYLSDFGVAKNISDKDRLSSAISNVKGTNEYLSPEVHNAKLEKPNMAKQDVWAIGVMTYELCTFNHPFNGESSSYKILAIINDPHTPIESKDYSEELKDLISCMLIKDPELRPSI